MENTPVIYEKQSGISVIRLNRPCHSNRINLEMQKGLEEAVIRAEEDPETRVVVIAANGSDFCAGFDITDASSSLGEDAEWSDRRKNTQDEVKLWTRILRSRKPYIGALKGWVIGGGYALALTCDCLVASEDTVFDNTEFACGMSYVSYTPLEFWKMPLNVAKEKLFTGYSITASEAHRLGFVNHVVPREELESCAIALAQRMLKLSPYTLTMHKAFANMACDLQGMLNILPYSEETFSISRTIPGTEEDRKIWEYGKTHTGEELIEMTQTLFKDLRKEERSVWRNEITE